MLTTTAATAKVVIKLRLVLFKECGYWVAQCLDRDIAVQAETIKDATKGIQRTIAAQMAVDTKAGRKPLDGIPAAPSRYWKMFEAGEELVGKPPVDLVQAGESEAVTLPPPFMINAIEAELRVS